MPMNTEDYKPKLDEKINELISFQLSGQYTACDRIWQEINQLFADAVESAYFKGVEVTKEAGKQQFKLRQNLLRYREEKKAINLLQKQLTKEEVKEIISKKRKTAKELQLTKQHNVGKVRAKRKATIHSKYVKKHIPTKGLRPIFKIED